MLKLRGPRQRLVFSLTVVVVIQSVAVCQQLWIGMQRLFLNIRGPGGYIGVHSGNPTFGGRGWGVKAGGDKPAGVTSPPSIQWAVG